MQISLICCPFQTSFGCYGSSLKDALERQTGGQVQWVASNCGCGDPIEVNRQYQAKQCDYFEMPVLGEYQSPEPWKRRMRGMARTALFSVRARKYCGMSRHADVVHFQQILNAYGSKTVFSWLRNPSSAIRVVTVHELDNDQLEAKETNLTYNRADAVIVHCDDMKQHLIRLNVQAEKIHVVLHGTEIPESSPGTPKSGIVFYGGHKLMSNKGIETVMKATVLLGQRMGTDAPKLSIHGHYSSTAPSAAIELAARHGVTDRVIWLNQIPDREVVKLYQRSLACVLPYTGSFAGGIAAMAAACSLPVVCTRKAGLPDHLGDTGIWIDENNPEQLVDRLVELLTNETRRQLAGNLCQQQAKAHLSWDTIAGQTLQIYNQASRLRLAA